MTPHRQLLADYADSGSEEAFRELVGADIGLVYGSALRLVNGHSQLAEAITQTVFTDLARRATTAFKATNPLPFLLRAPASRTAAVLCRIPLTNVQESSPAREVST